MLKRANRDTVSVVNLLLEPELPLCAMCRRSANHVPEGGEERYFRVESCRLSMCFSGGRI
jgi:hypothetical protein|eukprot:7390680-Prymnesium_polylepis.1